MVLALIPWPTPRPARPRGVRGSIRDVSIGKRRETYPAEELFSIDFQL
jgi:hypothetical protein